MYLAVTKISVRAVLVRDDYSKQYHIYHVSKTLLDAEIRYTHLEQLVLA